MWIIPKNHPQFSVYAPACVASKTDCIALLDQSMLSLTWKSKPLSSKTFVRLWKRVWWMPRLFGRILKHSMVDRFTAEYTASWPVIHAKENPQPAIKKEPAMNDGFGRILKEQSKQLNLFGASSKTSPAILNYRSQSFLQAFEIWVLGLKRDYTVRQKLAHHTQEKGFLYSPSGMASQIVPPLELLERTQKIWPTPTVMYSRADWSMEQIKAKQAEVKARTKKKGVHTGNGFGLNLAQAVKAIWPTPVSTEVRQGYQNRSRGKKGPQESLTTVVLNINGRQNQRSNPTISKNQEQLNPAWVAQLMGTTLEKIYFGCWGMGLCHNKPNWHLSTYSKNTA